MYSALSSFWTTGRWIKPHLHALKTSARHAKFGTVLTILRHGTPNFRRVNLSLPHVIWEQCSKFYECRDYLLEVSLGTGKRGTVPKIWRDVPIFLARVNGVLVSVKVKYVLSYCSTHKRIDRQYLFIMHTVHTHTKLTPDYVGVQVSLQRVICPKRTVFALDYSLNSTANLLI